MFRLHPPISIRNLKADLLFPRTLERFAMAIQLKCIGRRIVTRILSISRSYDTLGQSEYDGTGITGENNTVTAGQTLSYTLNGANLTEGYVIALTAVDSSGSNQTSRYLTMYSLAQLPMRSMTCQAVLTIRCHRSGVTGGARYLIESATSIDGPWTTIATTFSTTYRLWQVRWKRLSGVLYPMRPLNILSISFNSLKTIPDMPIRPCHYLAPLPRDQVLN